MQLGFANMFTFTFWEKFYNIQLFCTLQTVCNLVCHSGIYISADPLGESELRIITTLREIYIYIYIYIYKERQREIGLSCNLLFKLLLLTGRLVQCWLQHHHSGYMLYTLPKQCSVIYLHNTSGYFGDRNATVCMCVCNILSAEKIMYIYYGISHISWYIVSAVQW